MPVYMVFSRELNHAVVNVFTSRQKAEAFVSEKQKGRDLYMVEWWTS